MSLWRRIKVGLCCGKIGSRVLYTSIAETAYVCATSRGAKTILGAESSSTLAWLRAVSLVFVLELLQGGISNGQPMRCHKILSAFYNLMSTSRLVQQNTSTRSKKLVYSKDQGCSSWVAMDLNSKAFEASETHRLR